MEIPFQDDFWEREIIKNSEEEVTEGEAELCVYWWWSWEGAAVPSFYSGVAGGREAAYAELLSLSGSLYFCLITWGWELVPCSFAAGRALPREQRQFLNRKKHNCLFQSTLLPKWFPSVGKQIPIPEKQAPELLVTLTYWCWS